MASIFTNILLCAIPEVLYFTLFMIFTKNLKDKKFIYFGLMLIQYVILMNLLPYNVWFQLIYTFMSFVILKILYKEKAIITDIFMFAISSILLIITSVVSYMIVYYTIGIYAVAYILNRILMFGLLFIFKNKLNVIYKKLNNVWNRKSNSKVRSLTVRNISVIVFNVMFYVINFCMIYFITNLQK